MTEPKVLANKIVREHSFTSVNDAGGCALTAIEARDKEWRELIERKINWTDDNDKARVLQELLTSEVHG